MYQIRFALNEIERIKAYALRHQGLAIELGDKEWVLFPHHLFVDALDNEHAHVITAWAGDELIGTLRILFRSDGPFLEDDFYQWPWLSVKARLSELQLMQNAVLFDRAVVRTDFRRMGVYSAMLLYALNYVAEKHMLFALSSFAANNSNALAWSMKNKFELYPELITTQTGTWYLAYKQVGTIFSPKTEVAV